MKQLGTTDAVNACDCCGKTGLKFTFGVELDSGEIVHYGSTCVTKHTGKTHKAIESEVSARYAAAMEIKEAEYNKTVEYLKLRATMNEAYNLRLVGKDFYNFCTVARETANAKRNEIFAK